MSDHGSRTRVVTALALALAASGCCEVLHLGWARSYGPRTWRSLRHMDRALASAAKVDRHGAYDAATCEAACHPAGEVRVEGCYPVTVEVPVLPERILECASMTSFGSARVLVPRAEAAMAHAGKWDHLDPETCERLCPLDRERINYCKLEPDLPRSPPASEPFVVCVLHKPGGCGDPVLSQAPIVCPKG